MVNYFGVSKMMITHRDLDLLEQRQILKRIHGELIDSLANLFSFSLHRMIMDEDPPH